MCCIAPEIEIYFNFCDKKTTHTSTMSKIIYMKKFGYVGFCIGEVEDAVGMRDSNPAKYYFLTCWVYKSSSVFVYVEALLVCENIF